MRNQIYQEKLRWPWWLTLLMAGLDLSIVIAVWAGLGNTSALIAAIISSAFTAYLYSISTLRISVEKDLFFVGRATIEKKYLGDIRVLTGDEFRFLLGPGINPEAFHAFRFWIKRGLKVEIKDSRDPTPYWLVSSKRPEKLLEALQN
ncbi:MAG: DUF3093 domain-containing protein [Candidatus Nanopelagicaceae bacterium]|nr:DUF3093 domain-containing protein [Candidatus Nanopelagicaceae bacterium]